MNVAINRASIFMAASWSGLSGLLLYGAGKSPSAPQAFTTIGISLIIVSSFALLLTRRADEYTTGLWNAGASVAFGALLINFIGLAFVEGLIEGFADRAIDRIVSGDLALLLSIAAFYIGLFIRRLLGEI